MTKKLLTTTGLLIALALFLAINIISNATFTTTRLDLTENRLYTLSQGTHNILQNLPEPVTLRLYLSKKLVSDYPAVSTFAIQVRELLQEYQRIAGDKLKLQILDPEPFSEEEDRAVGYGLKGIPLDDSNIQFYFGLVGTNSIDDQEIIPFFQPNRTELLEYDLTRLVYRLANPKRKIIGIMSSLPIQGTPSVPFMQRQGAPAWTVVEQIQQLFEVKTFDPASTDKIPEEVAVLFLVHPKNLNETATYAVDQFILNGGRAVIFVDPHSEADNPRPDPNDPTGGMNAPRHSDLSTLFDVWGLDVIDNKVVADLSLAQKVQMPRQGRNVVADYPVWLNFRTPEWFDTQDVITSKLGNLTFASAGALVKKDNASINLQALVQTSPQAMLVDTEQLRFMPDPDGLVKNFKPEKQFILAGRVTGKVKTAFPNGKPKKEGETTPTTDEKTPHLTESKDNINVIVVADTDMLDDRFWVQTQNFFGQRFATPFASNGEFVTNALDNLTGSNDLISVRNRGTPLRPFTWVETLKKEAEKRFSDKAKELEASLAETEQKILALRNPEQKKGGELILSVEQQKELENFLAEKVRIRKELRAVQHDLQKDIENLESRLKFINIGLMPLLIGFSGIGIAIYRNQRRRRSLKAALV